MQIEVALAEWGIRTREGIVRTLVGIIVDEREIATGGSPLAWIETD